MSFLRTSFNVTHMHSHIVVTRIRIPPTGRAASWVAAHDALKTRATKTCAYLLTEGSHGAGQNSPIERMVSKVFIRKPLHMNWLV